MGNIPKLMLFITENISSSLRGELTKWLLQLKPGVFIGTLSKLVGEKLWKKIQEKQGNGGSIWVKATNNEQKFQLAISGKTRWTIRDFDNLQLICHPSKKSLDTSINDNLEVISKKKIETIKVKNKSNNYSQEIPNITWDTQNTPDNFIVRKVLFEIKDSKIDVAFSGSSAYREYPPEKLWTTPWMDEIKNVGIKLLQFILNLKDLSQVAFYNKKLMCIDIETTDYLPKAQEGFINIIGIAIFNSKKAENARPTLELFQAFNITRKKAEVPTLLSLIFPYLTDIDCLLVFNKDFDIKIINKVINDYSLKFSFPSNIIDLQEDFPNLKTLERFLSTKFGVIRNATEKDKYSEYYNLFKGNGKIGNNKKIEPIGTYNLTDALTPLFAYLVINSQQ